MFIPSRKFNVKIFADGADKQQMLQAAKNPIISGFTTNPTLMKKAGVTNYKQFAQDILSQIKDKSISFEVFSDDFNEMEKQALEISSWGKNVYIKIPITNTKGLSSANLIKRLSDAKVNVNVTAMMTFKQIETVVPALENSPGAYVSIFAGRIADSGHNPLPLMQKVVEYLKPHPQIELIWASPREVLNVVQAESIGCQIITITNSILSKLSTIDKNLDEFSLDTVKMFYNDAVSAGFSI